MDPAYYRHYATFYRRLYQTAPLTPPPGFDTATDAIRAAIDAADADLDAKGLPRLRPDARYLLLANFAEMIARPVLMARKVSLAGLTPHIHDDIRLLVEEAAKRAKDSTETSAHAVIDALAGAWQNLAVMSLDVWE